MKWRPRLKVLKLGGCFNQPIGGVMWPSTLEKLVFKDLRQPVQEVQWPPRLDELALLGRFNRAITIVAWPTSLEILSSGRKFQKPVCEVRWPSSLLELKFTFVVHETRRFLSGEGAWPPNLRVTVGGKLKLRRGVLK